MVFFDLVCAKIRTDLTCLRLFLLVVLAVLFCTVPTCSWFPCFVIFIHWYTSCGKYLWLVVLLSLFPEPMVFCPPEIVMFVVLDCRFVKPQKWAFYAPSPRFFAFLHLSCMPPHLPYFCSHPMDSVYRFSDMLRSLFSLFFLPFSCATHRSLLRAPLDQHWTPDHLSVFGMLLTHVLPTRVYFSLPKTPLCTPSHKYVPDAKIHLCTSPLTSWPQARALPCPPPHVCMCTCHPP